MSNAEEKAPKSTGVLREEDGEGESMVVASEVGRELVREVDMLAARAGRVEVMQAAEVCSRLG